MLAAADSEENAHDEQSPAAAYAWQYLLFVTPALILHQPPDSEMNAASAYQIMSRRLALAEIQRRHALIDKYMFAAHLQQVEAAIRGLLNIEALSVPDDAEMHYRALHAARTHQSALAKSSLLARPIVRPDSSVAAAAPLTLATQETEENLETECARFQHVADRGRKTAAKSNKIANASIYGTRTRLNLGAAVGCSTWSNKLLRAVLCARGGVEAFQRWASLWLRARIPPATAMFWIQARIAMLFRKDVQRPGGWEVPGSFASMPPFTHCPEDIDDAHPYKLRTIACAEVLLKAVESVGLSPAQAQTTRRLAPCQSGTVAPGAPQLIFSFSRVQLMLQLRTRCRIL